MPIKPPNPPIPKSTLPKSKLFKVGIRDLLRGGILAALTGAITSVYQMSSAGAFSWSTLGLAILAAFSGYLVLNLATNNTGQLLKKDNPPQP